MGLVLRLKTRFQRLDNAMKRLKIWFLSIYLSLLNVSQKKTTCDVPEKRASRLILGSSNLHSVVSKADRCFTP